MRSVYQHWDPLEEIIVGRCYAPEFFHWIKHPKTRRKFEKLSEETEQDFQGLIRLLEKFGVQVIRPKFPEDMFLLFIQEKWVQPPVSPRDYFLMIHDKFWVPHVPNASHAWSVFYRQNKKSWWPDFIRPQDFYVNLPEFAKEISRRYQEFCTVDQLHLDAKLNFYQHVFDHLTQQGNEIAYTNLDFINGCFVSRIGHDLYFATQTYYDDKQSILDQVNTLFPDTRNHVVNSGGHGDAVYCPVAPGLIISLNDIPTYADSFPDWEVVYLPPSNYSHMREFRQSMKRNKGRWFIPGFEQSQDLQNIVNYYFDEWVGQVSETVFDVNILIIDTKNIVVSTHNDLIEKACARYDIEVHVVPFRHKYFWDCGIHCVTNDLSRRGSRCDWFSDR